MSRNEICQDEKQIKTIPYTFSFANQNPAAPVCIVSKVHQSMQKTWRKGSDLSITLLVLLVHRVF